MDDNDKLVSKTIDRGKTPSFDHKNPLTSRGYRLPSKGGGLSFQVHECGAFVVQDHDWDFQHVVSPFWRLYYNTKPGCAVIFRGKSVAVDPTQAVIIPEQVEFDCAGQRGVPHLWLHFSLDHAVGAVTDAPLVLNVDGVLRSALKKLKRAVEGPTRGEVISHLCAGVMHLCLAQVGERIVPRRLTPRMQTLLEFVDHVLNTPISNSLLAQRSGLSKGAFLRWFRRESGVTPAIYVRGRRVREACRRLAFTDETIDEIASAVGFADRHHFSRVFKQRMGCGPAGFRKEPSRVA